jgi:catechol 2,3-dioxygenase-like lactoylglutathione lyase family enzyme
MVGESLNKGERPMAEHPDFVAVDHVTITVQDIDTAKRFYSDILGLPVLTDVTVDGTSTSAGFAVQGNEVVILNDPDESPLQQSPHAVRRMVIFERVGGVSLTLITHPGDELPGSPADKLDRLGYTHLAFDVRNLDAFTTRIRSRGLEPVAPGFYQDPEGNLIQIQEVGHSDRIHHLYHERYGNNA